MKQILKYLAYVSLTLMFLVLTEVFVSRLKRVAGTVSSNAVFDESMSAYPISAESPPVVNLDHCLPTRQKELFTHPTAGYSLEYPSTTRFRLMQSNTKPKYDSVRIILRASCFDLMCRGSNRMEIIVKENQNKLPIKEFVEQKLSSTGSAEKLLSKLDTPFNILEYGGSYVKVADQQAIRIQDHNRSIEMIAVLGVANPRVFVPHGEFVLELYIGSSYGLESFTPCVSAIRQFDRIVQSLKLFS